MKAKIGLVVFCALFFQAALIFILAGFGSGLFARLSYAYYLGSSYPYGSDYYLGPDLVCLGTLVVLFGLLELYLFGLAIFFIGRIRKNG